MIHTFSDIYKYLDDRTGDFYVVHFAVKKIPHNTLAMKGDFQ
jgi:hypothetical protein